MFGSKILVQMPAAFSLLPRSTWASRGYVAALVVYLLPPLASLFWLELSIGKLRRFLQIMVLVGLVMGVTGVCSDFLTHSPSSLVFPYYRTLVIFGILVLAVVTVVPSLAKRFLVIPRGIVAIGTLIFLAGSLYENLQDFLRLPYSYFIEPLALGVWIFSMGYVAVEKVFLDERRLLSLENELAIAREIQNSILPSSIPMLKNLHISAAYLPMRAVAGDFYDFVPLDQNRIGFLVADVSGHGVPAALIASMIKVGMQSVVSCAHDPRTVLLGLNRVLSGQLRDQFVTAAYLLIDTQNAKALYSAAGHPPLLRWRAGKLERIESNGIVFGVLPEPDYPVCEMSIDTGERFLLYTDGVIEAENTNGDSFGDSKLEQIVRINQSRPPSELSDQLLSEIRRWQPTSTTQQDDITLIVVDVVGSLGRANGNAPESMS